MKLQCKWAYSDHLVTETGLVQAVPGDPLNIF